MPPNDQQGGSSTGDSPLATTRSSTASTTGGNTAFQPAKAVIFDLDGTLLDTETLSCSAVLDAFGPSLSESMRDRLRQEEGYKLPWELKKQTLGLQGHAWIPLVLEYGRQNWGVRLAADHDDKYGSGNGSSNIGTPVAPSVAEFWERWEVRLSEMCANVDECPGATRLVQTLAKHNVPLAIATSSRAVAVAKKRIRHDDIFKHIPIIVCGDDPAVKNGKPAPDGFLEAARRLGIDPGDCLVFEDAVAGVQSARAAGCRVIAVPDPRMEEDAFVEAKADEVIRSMNDFDYEKWLGLEC
jgi:beta-phosphoglucomutase-like phosphatase (HAD superfamily)